MFTSGPPQRRALHGIYECLACLRGLRKWRAKRLVKQKMRKEQRLVALFGEDHTATVTLDILAALKAIPKELRSKVAVVMELSETCATLDNALQAQEHMLRLHCLAFLNPQMVLPGKDLLPALQASVGTVRLLQFLKNEGCTFKAADVGGESLPTRDLRTFFHVGVLLKSSPVIFVHCGFRHLRGLRQLLSPYAMVQAAIMPHSLAALRESMEVEERLASASHLAVQPTDIELCATAKFRYVETQQVFAKTEWIDDMLQRIAKRAVYFMSLNV